LKTQAPIIASIDLAATSQNPTGWATLRGRVVSACHLFSDKEIVSKIHECNPTLIAVDAPLSLPKNKEFTRKADREMQKRRYLVFPPSFRTMKKLTVRAIKLTKKMRSEGFNVIEVHPASTRKALRMPTKEWSKIQEIFSEHGLCWRHKNTHTHTTRNRRRNSSLNRLFTPKAKDRTARRQNRRLYRGFNKE